MWLRDFLPQDIPNARILTYGYDASDGLFGDKLGSTMGIRNVAKYLILDIDNCRQEIQVILI
jgi:hypothetical protein